MSSMLGGISVWSPVSETGQTLLRRVPVPGRLTSPDAPAVGTGESVRQRCEERSVAGGRPGDRAEPEWRPFACIDG
jgi:hypothetical protein